MKKFLLLLTFQLAFVSISTMLLAQTKESVPDPAQMAAYPGYFDVFYELSSGKVWLEIKTFEEEFLLVHGLQAGLGSNDIGLDRGQIDNGKVVSFRRAGPKVLLVQHNYEYRANSDNPAERRAVKEAFAESTLWGFELTVLPGNRFLIDFTPFLLSDQHGIANSLKRSKEGKYSIDAARSAVFSDRLKSFPENTELEATLTFKGSPEGKHVRTVSPDAEWITLRQHISLVKLPDSEYKPRIHLPESGFIYLDFYDYAQAVDQPLEQRYIMRHRLEKKDPNARRSEAVEPIIYYLDPGTPEPIRSALLEGAGWWNEAFEEAGFIDAFQVKMLPEDADPMDVRYNVIQWVHRSTRGWSYGNAVIDPRTGEIIKGHVSLGSLRVRQDFLIAQGLSPIYENGPEPDPRALEMALARLRQLSAHEVGHTIGLTHNFAASMNERASVMDYPHPYIEQDPTGLDFDAAYDTGIGEWDKQAIIYGYSQFDPDENEEERLEEILDRSRFEGLLFITDTDARPMGGANPNGHLWDNTDDPIRELERLLELRRIRLNSLSRDNIMEDAPNFELERLLTPLYMAHRYQIEACAKLIGGVAYSYEDESTAIAVDRKLQAQALDAILEGLSPRQLAVPEDLLELLSPPPPGYNRDREFFNSYTAPVFDPIAAAEALGNHSLELLLHPNRLARISRQHALGKRTESLQKYLENITLRLFTVSKRNNYEQQLGHAMEVLFVERLFKLAHLEKADASVRAAASWQIQRIETQLKKENAEESAIHDAYLLERIRVFRLSPKDFKPLPEPKVPPGSPIGCGGGH
ncbi:MAG: DUF5117 domain-containing protein [Bacteroidetes bacterium]|nr:DUF5117 domain-containing protein [Bacteroidota bacterium]